MSHSNERSGDGDRLNGWKEIASFLGKGVRTVQRWELHYDLPIHRIGRDGGEIVFAFRSEIDQWSRSTTLAKSSPRGHQPPREVPSVSAETEIASPLKAAPASAVPDAQVGDRQFNFRITDHSRFRVLYIAGLAVLGVVVIAILLIVNPATGRALPQPAKWSVDATSLKVFDSIGVQIWHHTLDFQVSVAEYLDAPRHVGTQNVLLTDLDGDANTEVVVAERSLIRDRSRALVVFNHDGTIRSRIQPVDTVRFGGKEYAGPWAIFRMFVTANPDATKSIWVAYIHGSDFPTLLLEIDGKSGREKSRYWSNGYIDSLLVTRWNNRPVVLVGATNNDTRGGSLAVFDYGSVSGSAPAAQEAYRCTSCSPGGPAQFFIFPLRCIGRAIRGTASVGDLWMDDADGLHVMVWEGPMDYAASAWYVLSADAQVRSAQYVDTARGYHDQKTREGLLDHAFGDLDQRDLLPLLRWTASAFASTAGVAVETRQSH
jgi:hypothetical protein